MKLRFQLSKRQKFFIAAVGVVVGVIFIRVDAFTALGWRFREAGFVFYSLIITILSLRDEDFSGVEWLTLPILPVFFSIGASLVYPLLPSEIQYLPFWRMDTDSGLFLSTVLRTIYLAGIFIGFYACLLSANIFNVAGVKTIQLIRAAHSVGFLLTLVSAFLLYTVIYSLHLNSFGNFLVVFIISFPLILQAVWSINLEPYLGREVIRYTFVISLILAQLSWALSYWPVPGLVNAMVVTAASYEGIGVVQYQLLGKLKPTVIKELFSITVIFILVILFSASWLG